MNDEKLEKVRDTLLKHAQDASSKVRGSVAYDLSEVTISYGNLAKESGVGVAVGMSAYLNHIPELECLGVAKKLGRPGTEKFAADWEGQVRTCIALLQA